ncbi:MAG TPA: transcriptional regulator [Lachnospiraceae bacterium]|jgi:Nitrogen regulatory protein PII|nr:transcriptional regulator [Lachnospiraceae bacterium]
MKKLEIIIRPDKLEKLKIILNELEIGGITVTSVVGCGNQKGLMDVDSIKGLKVSGMNLIPKIHAVVVVQDDEVDNILAIVHSEISSGTAGDGKVFISDISDCMRIRTGERGKKSL